MPPHEQVRYDARVMPHVPPVLLDHLLAASGVWWLLLPIIILGVMVLEDVTIALVAILNIGSDTETGS